VNGHGGEVRLSIYYQPFVEWILTGLGGPVLGGAFTWVAILHFDVSNPWAYVAIVVLPLIALLIVDGLREAFEEPGVVLLLEGDDFIVREYWPHRSGVIRFPVSPESRPRLVECQGSEDGMFYRIQMREPGGRLITVGQRSWKSSAVRFMAEIDWHIDRRYHRASK
jgi:hypothetical protein